MEPVSTQGLRKRHTTTNKMSKETASKMVTLATDYHSFYELDEEITSTPFQTRSESPSRGQLMPHTPAEAAKFMESLHEIVKAENDNADGHSDAITEVGGDIIKTDIENAAPIAPSPAKRHFGFTQLQIVVLYLCMLVMLIPVIHHAEVGGA